jgi:hypothetical protein
MANIANTVYRIVGDDATLTKVENSVKVGMSLQEVLSSLGCKDFKGYAKGEIVWIENDPEGLWIDLHADTAWNENPDFINALKKAIDCIVGYHCEEPGCDYYATNISDAIWGEYVADGIDGTTEYYKTFEELKENIVESLALELAFEENDGHDDAFKTFYGMKDWLENYYDKHKDYDPITIHHFDIIDPII